MSAQFTLKGKRIIEIGDILKLVYTYHDSDSLFSGYFFSQIQNLVRTSAQLLHIKIYGNLTHRFSSQRNLGDKAGEKTGRIC